MMLIILSRSPIEAVRLVPYKIKFKQLLELGQLICSAGYSSVFKPVPQGKEIQEWIKKNTKWTCVYFESLCCWAAQWIKMSQKTKNRFAKILYDLKRCCGDCRGARISSAIFRYSSQYKGTPYLNNTELPINEAILQYEEYVKWKGNKWQ